MATTLYETLGLGRNASPEDIRKAYRRRALQTHPDRLPPNISATDKAVAEEEFRKVNNAYEVLNDEQNRKLYDRYGVWPPPATGPDSSRRTNHRQNSFDAFNFDPFGSFGHQQSFVFTDPFVLFNSLFGDIHQLHRQFFDDDPFSASQFHGAFGRSPFDRMGDPFGHTLMSPFGGSIFGSGPGLLGSGPMFSDFMGPNSRPGGASYGSVSEAVGRNGQWVSQSTVTRSINGRTETTTKRRDAEGNEHITYSSPEGERYTINGVEQPLPNGRAIASAPDPSQRTRPPPPLAIAAPPSTAAATAGSFAQPSASGFHAPSSSPHQPQPRAQAQQYPAYTQLSTSPPRRSPSVGSHNYPAHRPPIAEPIPAQYQSSRTGYHGHRSHGAHDRERRDVHDATHGHRSHGRSHRDKDHPHELRHSHRDARIRDDRGYDGDKRGQGGW